MILDGSRKEDDDWQLLLTVNTKGSELTLTAFPFWHFSHTIIPVLFSFQNIPIV